MKIYIDENIPYGKDFFKEIGDVITFSGRTVTAEEVQYADILLVRSITKVNSALLELNKVIKFVGTATIGTDHVDLTYLASRAIKFHSAPGCNKISVAQYVLSVLMVLSETKQFSVIDKSVAIVGAGNTGTAVYDCLSAIGINCLLYDPPLQRAGDIRDFCEFDDVLTADVISLHVPKICQGRDKTTHMFDLNTLKKLSSEQVLINACRGEVVDNKALLFLAENKMSPIIVLDVWENEPNIDKQLLPFIDIATPHIAGYSLDGKVRGTEMLYQAVTLFIDQKVSLKSDDFMEMSNINEINITSNITIELLKSLVHLIYDVRRDDASFRKMVMEEGGFDAMRKNYPERRELSTLTLNLKHNALQMFDLNKIGFSVNNK